MAENVHKWAHLASESNWMAAREGFRIHEKYLYIIISESRISVVLWKK